MTADIALTLAIAALTLLLFMLEWLPADITGMVVMVTLMLLGQVTPAEGISGFSNPATLTVMAMFILSAGIARTGALQRLNQALIYWSGKQPAQQMLMVLFVLTTVLTGILSNIAAVILLFPVGVQIAETLNITPLTVMAVITFAASNSFMTPIGYQTNTMVYGAGGYCFLDFVRVGGPLWLIMAVVEPPLASWLYGL